MDEFVALVPNIVLENEFISVYLLKTFKIDLDALAKFNGIHSADRIEEKKKFGLDLLTWARKLKFRRQKLEDKLIRILLLLGL